MNTHQESERFGRYTVLPQLRNECFQLLLSTFRQRCTAKFPPLALVAFGNKQILLLLLLWLFWLGYSPSFNWHRKIF